MTAHDPGLTGDQISALEMLAGSPNGCAEAEMKAKANAASARPRRCPWATRTAS
jgi:hypothetical protein